MAHRRANDTAHRRTNDTPHPRTNDTAHRSTNEPPQRRTDDTAQRRADAMSHGLTSAVEHRPVTMERTAERAELSLALINLFRGVVYRTEQPRVWHAIVRQQAAVADHASLFDLRLIVNEAEGYAFLRQEERDEDGADGFELPRLVSRRPLSYPVSLLLALLRKKLAEHDASGGDPRLILTKTDMADMLRLFLPETGDEVRFFNRLDTYIEHVVKLGFLRRLRGQSDHFEVMRILAAFVDAQWLSEFEERLAEYRAHALGEDEESGDGAQGGRIHGDTPNDAEADGAGSRSVAKE